MTSATPSSDETAKTQLTPIIVKTTIRRWFGSMPAWKVFLLSLATSVLLVFGTELFLVWRYRSLLHRHIERIRADGFPTTMEELYSEYIPEEQNAAPLIAQAVNLLKTEKYSVFPKEITSVIDEKLLWQTGYIDDRHRRDHEGLFLDFCAAHESAFDLLRQAALKPRCRFPHESFDTFDNYWPGMSDLRILSKFMITMALIELEADRPDEAVQWILLQQSLARHLQQEKSIIGQLVCRVISNGPWGYLEPHVSASLAEPRHLNVLLQSLLETRTFESGENVIIAERAFFLHMTAVFGSYRGKSNIYSSVAAISKYKTVNDALGRLLVVSHLKYADALLGLKYLDRELALLRNPPPDAAEQWDRLRNESESLPDWYVFSKDVLPVFNGDSAFRENDARALVYELALRLELHKVEHGAYPASLASIPGDWTDPCTGKQLEYSVIDDAFTLYSPGRKTPPEGEICWPAKR